MTNAWMMAPSGRRAFTGVVNARVPLRCANESAQVLRRPRRPASPRILDRYQAALADHGVWVPSDQPLDPDEFVGVTDVKGAAHCLVRFEVRKVVAIGHGPVPPHDARSHGHHRSRQPAPI
jgi:hypothetical protein